jgi:hypothetical protein
MEFLIKEKVNVTHCRTIAFTEAKLNSWHNNIHRRFFPT